MFEFHCNGFREVTICDRSSHKRCSIKQLFLKMSQYSQERTCVGVFSDKVAGLQAVTLLKRDTPTKVISCESCKKSTNTYSEKLANGCLCRWQILSPRYFYHFLGELLFLWGSRYFLFHDWGSRFFSGLL